MSLYQRYWLNWWSLGWYCLAWLRLLRFFCVHELVGDVDPIILILDVDPTILVFDVDPIILVFVFLVSGRGCGASNVALPVELTLLCWACVLYGTSRPRWYVRGWRWHPYNKLSWLRRYDWGGIMHEHVQWVHVLYLPVVVWLLQFQGSHGFIDAAIEGFLESFVCGKKVCPKDLVRIGGDGAHYIVHPTNFHYKKPTFLEMFSEDAETFLSCLCASHGCHTQQKDVHVFFEISWN